MSQETLNATEVAKFLANNPDFFEQHTEIFSALKVPHPHKAQAISLGERQILTLRSRLKSHENQLQSLIYNASGNQKINSALMQWCASMLAQQNAQLIPAMITSSLQEQFDLISIALQVWDLPKLEEQQYSQYASPELATYADSLSKPYCGPIVDQPVISWLNEETKSIAIIPLKSPGNNQSIGLLVFGSESPDRFTSAMGTEFLELIAKLCGAALSRLQ